MDKATWIARAATDKSDHHLECHANSTARFKCGGSLCALYFANMPTHLMQVSLQRPPISHASVTSTILPAACAASRFQFSWLMAHWRHRKSPSRFFYGFSAQLSPNGGDKEEPHRRKPRALCDRSPRSLRSSWRRSCESRQSVGRWYFSVAAYHSARAFFCQLPSQESQALIGIGQGAWDL